jgi:putative spermidine/putrescine transport system ATP-binding protein
MSSAGRRVDVSNLWKRYGSDAYVVRDVSFDLEPGEFLTLLGPSGSGKSTTLLMVAGFEKPTRGAIRVDGTDIAGKLPEHRNFGVVFQGYGLFPHMTARENVEFPLRMKSVPSAERRRRAGDMLEKVGLGPFASRRPRELSGGQQQRVALARALVFEPDALLLDEPLGALDRKLREQLQFEIKEIQRRVGISILFVTHDQDEAMMMSDRIAVMLDGRIVQLGTPPEVYLHPTTPFVAGFLGETNMLPGVMYGCEGAHAVVRFPGGTLGHARLPRDGTVPANGEKVVVALRPERIRLNALSEAMEPALEGIVASHAFLGRSARYVVQLPGQPVIVSTTLWPPPASLRDGAPVRLGWSREDAQILGAEPADAAGFAPDVSKEARPMKEGNR